jgi:2,3-bisphosphoglycerate-dependent phosphoglycerate mutase
MSGERAVIYFIRHAQSRPSAKLHHSEWPLSDLGKAQASQLASLLANLRIQKVISSPYARCIDTVAPFVKASNLSFEMHHDLRERDIVNTVGADFHDFYAIWKKSWTDFHFSMPGCESSLTAQRRFVDAIRAIVDTHPGSVLGVSTHGNVLGLFLNFINPRFQLAEAERIRNPDVLKIVAHADGYELDQDFMLPGLEESATHYSSTPIDKEK